MDNNNYTEQSTPLLETVSFTGGLPCRLTKKHRNIDDSSTLHYASTIEILIVDGAEGTVSLGAKQYTTKKKDILVTKKLLALSMCRSFTIPVSSSTSSSIMLITLAGNWKGSSAEIPSEMRQTPKMTAS